MLHMPWERNFGGSRVQLEIAEEWQKMGHQVKKFDYRDAFPGASPSVVATLTRPSFAMKARDFVRANAHRFDMIDAHQGNLPYRKEMLGFKGVLAVRSVGLYAFYREFARSQTNQFPPHKWKLRLLHWLYSQREKQEYPFYRRSLETCDLINLPNRDELAYVRSELGLGDKSFFFPFGLSQDRLAAFAETIQPAAVRLSSPTVAFIGTWGTRKGSRDWGEIIAAVRSRVPAIRFRFLGTGLGKEAVLADIPQQHWEAVEILPRFDSEELPQLLSSVTVGAFPSYIEGFGFAVLEKLACGIPTVAYDVPGPREMLGAGDRVPAGDLQQFSRRLVEVLQLETASYAQRSLNCVETARQFDWGRIAKDTLAVYRQFLER